MFRIDAVLITIAVTFFALPAAAGGSSPIDLPRLEFPPQTPETTRNCTVTPAIGQPATCEPAGG